VVRLNKGSGAKFTDQEGEEAPLQLEKGQREQIEGIYYRGEVKVNVGAMWLEGHKEPLWVMGNLPAGRLVEVYRERMNIEQTFKDSKSLLNIEKVMNKGRGQLEITLALVLLAYGLGLTIGEAARDEAYGKGGEKGGRRDTESGSSTRDSSFC